MILWLLKLGITMQIYNKDDIQFVTEFQCYLGTPCAKSLHHQVAYRDRKGNYSLNIQEL